MDKSSQPNGFSFAPKQEQKGKAQPNAAGTDGTAPTGFEYRPKTTKSTVKPAFNVFDVLQTQHRETAMLGRETQAWAGETKEEVKRESQAHEEGRSESWSSGSDACSESDQICDSCYDKRGSHHTFAASHQNSDLGGRKNCFTVTPPLNDQKAPTTSFSTKHATFAFKAGAPTKPSLPKPTNASAPASEQRSGSFKFTFAGGDSGTSRPAANSFKLPGSAPPRSSPPAFKPASFNLPSYASHSPFAKSSRESVSNPG